MPWLSYRTKNLEDKFLFKFLPAKYLFDFLKTGSIWFSRADQFGDKMECVLIDDLNTKRPDYSHIESRKRKFLISCWHSANQETLALWDNYVDSKEKRRVFGLRFERDYLVDLVKEYIHANDGFHYQSQWVHGKVLYRNMITDDLKALNQCRVKYAAFRKEVSFRYENEYRFSVQLPSETRKEGFSYNIGNPKQLKFDILINPLLKKEEYVEPKSQVYKVGYGKHLKESALYKWLQPEKW